MFRSAVATLCMMLAVASAAQAQPACTRDPLVQAAGTFQVNVSSAMELIFHPEILSHQTEAKDEDTDGTPDLVQNAVLQLRVADRWYQRLFGMASPLQSARYRHVDGIQVCIERLSRGNGFALSRPVCGTQKDGKPHCVLRMQVGAHVRPRNLSPAHELFHLYQYTYNRFSQSWLIEGTARWAEAAFSAQSPRQVPLPQDEAALARMLAGSYETGAVWHRLTHLLDPKGSPGLLDNEVPERYVTGEQVWAHRTIHGAAFIRDVFEALGARNPGKAIDGLSVSKPIAKNLPLISDAQVWATVRQVAISHASRVAMTPELQRFLSLTGPGSTPLKPTRPTNP